MIELSPHDPARAFLAVYKYRENDLKPYLFRTNNSGRSWELLTDTTNGIPADHFVRVVREDPDRKGLLYAGTEFGLYVSFDDGKHWQSLQLNLPVTPITDLAVHNQDLVVTTQGRSFWILDDLTPLHQLTDAVARSQVHLFQPRVTHRTRKPRRFRAPNAPENPPYGVIVYYYFAKKPETPVTLEILDAAGTLVRAFSTKPEKERKEKKEGKLEVKAGLNRFTWDLTYPAPELVEGAIMGLSSTGGPTAPTGTYQVRLTAGDWTQTRSVELRKDPRSKATDADLKAQFDLAVAVRDTLTQTHHAIRNLRAVRQQVTDIAERAVRAGYDQKVKTAAETLSQKLTELEEELIQTKVEGGQDTINYPPRLDNQFAYLYSVVNAQESYPTWGSYELFEDLKAKLAPQLDQLQNLLQTDLAKFNALLRQEAVPRIIISIK